MVLHTADKNVEQHGKSRQREDVCEVAQVFGPTKQSVVSGGRGDDGGSHCGAREVLIHVDACCCVGDETWVHPGNGVCDPVLVLGHAGVDPGLLRLGTTLTKTDDSTLNPGGVS